MSFGGRLTLVKSVLGSLPLYYFSMFRVPLSVIKQLERMRKNFFLGGIREGKKVSWVKWDSVLASYGMGVKHWVIAGKKNLALLGKWWWMFRKEGCLWVRVIKSIHDVSGGLSDNRAVGEGGNGFGVWRNIIGVGKEMDGLGLEFSSSYRGVLGDGCDIKFWLDRWVDDRRLCDRFSRLFHQDRAKEGSVKDKGKWVNESDRWKWTLCEDGEFKVNIFVWRALKGRLPVREELDKRGIDLDLVLCPCCTNAVESSAHSLIMCDLAMSV
ncbi:reverse transcriptase domain, reverse transcriptase zinc-binding domain protein [Tanacetum coccineum]